MRRPVLYLCAVLGMSATSMKLHASTLLDFSFAAPGISGSGAFTASLVSGDTYLLTDISGLLNGSPMTLLAPADFGGNDNNVYTSAPFLDDSGFSFNAGSTEDFNIYYDPSLTSYFYCEHTAPFSCMTGDLPLTSFTLSAVPEPGSAFITLGVLGLLVIRRGRRPISN